MAKKKQLRDDEIDSLIANEQVIDRPMDQEMKESFISYSMMTLVDRAIPYIDGMKPVQRRILYDMYSLGLRPDTSYKKCARIAGDTIGRFHPHGEGSAYGALCNMVNDFDIRYPYIDGQGNFGSVDGDCAAAMRYTEAKLTKFGMEMVKEIGMNAVEMLPNFSEDEFEPEKLPSLPPALLLNGANGIATGYTTCMPSHNINNVADTIIAYLKDNNISIEELVNKYLIGPDLPSRGFLIKTDNLMDIYTTGTGKARIKAKIEIGENEETGDKQVEIVELPPDVQKPKLVKRIYDLYIETKDKRVIDVRDESEGNGIKIVIELTKTAIPQDIISELYEKCSLIKDKTYIMRIIADKKPQLLDLKSIIEYYCELRREVIQKRSKKRLEDVEKKIDILNGLQIALPNIKKIADIIVSAEDVESAKQELIKKFKLNEQQAENILERKLKSLSKKDANKIANDIKDLTTEKNELNNILGDLDAQIIREMEYLKKEYGDDRKTIVITEEENRKMMLSMAKQSVSDEDIYMCYTSKNEFEAISVEEYEKMVKKGSYKIKNVVYSDFIKCKKDSEFVILLENGEYIKTNYSILVSQNIIDKKQKFSAIFLYDKTSEDIIVSISDDGQMKKTKLVNFSSKVSKIDKYFNHDGEFKIVKNVLVKDEELVVNTFAKSGKINRFMLSSLSTNGIKSSVKSIAKLDDEDKIIGFEITEKDKEYNLIQFLNSEDDKFIKVTRLNEFDVKGRNVKPVATCKTKGEECINAVIVEDEFNYINAGKVFTGDINYFNLTKKGIKPEKTDIFIEKVIK